MLIFKKKKGKEKHIVAHLLIEKTAILVIKIQYESAKEPLVTLEPQIFYDWFRSQYNLEIKRPSQSLERNLANIHSHFSPSRLS